MNSFMFFMYRPGSNPYSIVVDHKSIRLAYVFPKPELVSLHNIFFFLKNQIIILQCFLEYHATLKTRLMMLKIQLYITINSYFILIYHKLV